MYGSWFNGPCAVGEASCHTRCSSLIVPHGGAMAHKTLLGLSPYPPEGNMNVGETPGHHEVIF